MASSIKSENLREVWKILDENENNSMLKSNDLNANSFAGSRNLLDDAITITSYRSPNANNDSVKAVNISNKSPVMSKKVSLISAKSPRVKSSASPSRVDSIKNQKPKIRNYNIKE
jgi:hypothetical protein